MRRHQAQGFTLLELLAAVSIVSLLVGLVLPALASARGAAHSAVCLSNARQIAEGFHILADTHDGQLPGIEDEEAWDVRVQEHLDSNEDIFLCPSDEDALAATADGFPGLSYGWGVWFEVDEVTSSLSGNLLASVSRPVLILVFEDIPGRHDPQRINAATVDGSARSYLIDEYLKNMSLPIR